MEFLWHSYRYYPYERELARRELRALLGLEELEDTDDGIRIARPIDIESVKNLVYFSAANRNGEVRATVQARLESSNGAAGGRQSTRYSAHGLHDYKGKFNPQVVRAILNILDVPSTGRLLDPFCGSGTSLLECCHRGMRAVGTDLNPLAVYIANAKLTALRTPAHRLSTKLGRVIKRFPSVLKRQKLIDNPRVTYLKSWFKPEILKVIESLKLAIEAEADDAAPVLLSVASNLLRDYSLQDPIDLRVRRRKSPLPSEPFVEAFGRSAAILIGKLADTQSVVSISKTMSKATVLDSRELRLGMPGVGRQPFDCALTSPPYATALPYIDTQRLSLVWLGLSAPSDLLSLEAKLVGSREIRGISKKALLAELLANSGSIPPAQAEYCVRLQEKLSEKDGFRRQAVPVLLYRYFEHMSRVFKAVRGCVKNGAPFALIVGGNHTILSGQRFDINTPRHLAEIGAASGWAHSESLPLQTYQRYGYHMSNAVSSEALVVMRAQ